MKGDDAAMTSRLIVPGPDGTRLAVDSYGSDGPGLLVLSGSAAPPGGYQGFARALAADFTVHVLHRRGRGASGPQGAAYTLGLEARDVLTVMKATGSRIVFGHSYGGLLAVWAGLNPEVPLVIDTLIAYEPPLPVAGSFPTAFVPSFEEALAGQRFARAMTILTRGMSVGGVLDRLPFAAETAAYWLMQHTIARKLRETLPTVPAEIAAAVAVVGPPDIYRALEVPTLLLLAERGPAWISGAVTAAAEHMPNARVEVMHRMDHNGPLLAPAGVAAVVRRFATGSAG